MDKIPEVVKEDGTFRLASLNYTEMGHQEDLQRIHARVDEGFLEEDAILTREYEDRDLSNFHDPNEEEVGGRGMVWAIYLKEAKRTGGLKDFDSTPL